MPLSLRNAHFLPRTSLPSHISTAPHPCHAMPISMQRLPPFAHPHAAPRRYRPLTPPLNRYHPLTPPLEQAVATLLKADALIDATMLGEPMETGADGQTALMRAAIGA